MKSHRPPERGDVIQVEWLDIFENITGDPGEARLARRTSLGLFWSYAEDDGVPVLVTTTTMDEELAGQNGYCIYPEACVRRVKIIRRARRARKEPEPDAAQPLDVPRG